MQLVKTYDDAPEKMKINGGMIERLVLDLEEGGLPQISASVLAKEMSVTRDTIAARCHLEDAASDGPLISALSLTQENGDDLTLNK